MTDSVYQTPLAGVVRGIQKELHAAADHFNKATDLERQVNHEVQRLRDHMHHVDVMLANLVNHAKLIDRELVKTRR